MTFLVFANSVSHGVVKICTVFSRDARTDISNFRTSLFSAIDEILNTLVDDTRTNLSNPNSCPYLNFKRSDR